MKTLQQIADEEGVTRQAVWLRTAKGKAYLKAYHKTDKFKAYWNAYQKVYYLRVTKNKRKILRNYKSI